MLLTPGVKPGVIEEVLRAAEAAAISEKEKFRRDERRGVFAVRRDDIGDALPARGDGQHPDIGQVVALRVQVAAVGLGVANNLTEHARLVEGSAGRRHGSPIAFQK